MFKNNLHVNSNEKKIPCCWIGLDGFEKCVLSNYPFASSGADRRDIGTAVPCRIPASNAALNSASIDILSRTLHMGISPAIKGDKG